MPATPAPTLHPPPTPAPAPTMPSLQRTVVGVHCAAAAWSGRLTDALVARLDARDERGDVAPRTVGIAVMAALAISVGVIITAKVKARAEGINL